MWSNLTEIWCRYLFWWQPAKGRQAEDQSEPGGKAAAQVHEPAAVSADIDAEAGIFEPAPLKPVQDAADTIDASVVLPMSDATTTGEIATDDLTAIKGIGATTQQRLYDAGIKRYTELASAEPEAIVELLRGRQPISSARVTDWIKQASALAGQGRG